LIQRARSKIRGVLPIEIYHISILIECFNNAVLFMTLGLPYLHPSILSSWSNDCSILIPFWNHNHVVTVKDALYLTFVWPDSSETIWSTCDYFVACILYQM